MLLNDNWSPFGGIWCSIQPYSFLCLQITTSGIGLHIKQVSLVIADHNLPPGCERECMGLHTHFIIAPDMRAITKRRIISSEHKYSLNFPKSSKTNHQSFTLTLTVLVMAIDAQWEGMGDAGSARYEPALLPPCPTIRVLSYSN